MDSIPIEVLTMVCDHVHAQHRPSLISLSLTSRRLYAAATKSLFRNIRITVANGQTLEAEVTSKLHALKSSGSLSYVRQLRIHGQMFQRNVSRRALCASRNNGPPLHDPEDPFADEWDSSTYRRLPKFMDLFWTPLAVLIKQLRCLAVVDIAYGGDIPRCIIQALHEHSNPGLKLRFDCGFAMKLDSNTGALASPLLSCVTLRYLPGVNVNKTFAGGLLANIHPKLEEVRDVYWGCYADYGPQNSSGSKAALKILRFAGMSQCLDFPLLHAWSLRTDFSVLKVLDIRLDVGACALEWATTYAPFVALTDLYVEKDLFPADDLSFCDIAEGFLRGLPRLQGLSILGVPPDNRLSAILQCLGPTLRRLHLRATKQRVPDRRHAQDEVDTIAKLCPVLEHLTFHIRRYKGNSREVALYSSFGKLQSLISLDLTLDASVTIGSSIMHDRVCRPQAKDPQNIDMESRRFFQQPFDLAARPGSSHLRLSDGTHLLNGHVRDTFINSAIDAKLARSIFRVIALSKAPTASPLKTLKLSVIGGGDFDFGNNNPSMSSLKGVNTVIEELSRPWTVTPCLRHDEPDALLATELAPRSPSWMQRQEQQDLPAHVKRIFRHIWQEQDWDCWRDEWESFPLAEHELPFRATLLYAGFTEGEGSGTSIDEGVTLRLNHRRVYQR